MADSDTTMESDELADFPEVVSPDIAVVILDPLGLTGSPEIAYITAHTASATTATVTRGQETSTGGAAAREHLTGITWRHGPTPADWDWPNTGGAVAITPDESGVLDFKTPAEAGVSSITAIINDAIDIEAHMPMVSETVGHRFQIAYIYNAVPTSITYSIPGSTGSVGIVGTPFSISPSTPVYLFDCIAGPDFGTGEGWSLTPYGPNDASMVPVAATPSNYTPDDPSAEGHLGGIDDALGIRATIINTDSDPGTTIYVGTVDPDGPYSPVAGDVWLDTST